MQRDRACSSSSFSIVRAILDSAPANCTSIFIQVDKKGLGPPMMGQNRPMKLELDGLIVEPCNCWLPCQRQVWGMRHEKTLPNESHELKLKQTCAQQKWPMIIVAIRIYWYCCLFGSHTLFFWYFCLFCVQWIFYFNYYYWNYCIYSYFFLINALNIRVRGLFTEDLGSRVIYRRVQTKFKRSIKVN